MKHKWITTIITAGLVGSGMVLADDKDKPSDRGPGKGGPDREEMRKKILEKFDKDGDGKLNEAEQAEAREAGKKRAEEFFAKIDKNGDGKISQDEAPEAWARMSKADKDGDGAVSKEELAAARTARGGKGGPGKGGPGKGGPGKGDRGKGGPGKGGDSGERGNPFEEFDKNADGKLSQDEVPAEAWARMSKADKDGDGLVSGEELKQAHKNRPDAGPGKPGDPKDGTGKPRGPKDGTGKANGPKDGRGNPIEKFDKNGDGKLSQDEVPAEAWARMSKADKDGDGLVSGEELKQAYKNRQGAGPNKPRKPKDGDS